MPEPSAECGHAATETDKEVEGARETSQHDMHHCFPNMYYIYEERGDIWCIFKQVEKSDYIHKWPINRRNNRSNGQVALPRIKCVCGKIYYD